MDRAEFEFNLRQTIDKLVEVLGERIGGIGKDIGVDEDQVDLIMLTCVSDTKEIVNKLVPNKSPLTSLMVIVCLDILLRWQHHDSIVDRIQEFESMSGLAEELSEESSAEDAIDMLNDRQEALGNRYRNIDLNGTTTKVADLGDLTGHISLN